MQPLPLAMKLPEIHTILENQTPESIAQTATTLWYRYHAFENWGVVIVDAAVQLLSSLSVAAVTMLLRELNERLALGVDGHLGRWISTMTASEIATLFSGELGVPLAELLAGLAADGTISGSNVLRSVVLPVLTALVQTTARRQLAAWTPISSLLTAILGEGVSSEVTPTNLVVLLRTSSRRATFFTRQTLPDVGRCLVLLLVQRALWAKTDEVEMVKQATTLLVLLSSSSPFRKVVAQEPQALAAAMLESPFATTANAQESYRPMILAGLLFCLNNGASGPSSPFFLHAADHPADTPANLVSNEDWDAFLSGLNVWRLAISKIEVQACLEGLDLDDSRSGKEKLEALNKLSSHFLDRVCLGDSQTFLGEQVVKCYHGRATDEVRSPLFWRRKLTPEPARQRRVLSHVRGGGWTGLFGLARAACSISHCVALHGTTAQHGDPVRPRRQPHRAAYAAPRRGQGVSREDARGRRGNGAASEDDRRACGGRAGDCAALHSDGRYHRARPLQGLRRSHCQARNRESTLDIARC